MLYDIFRVIYLFQSVQPTDIAKDLTSLSPLKIST